MVRGPGKYKQKRGGGRSFSRDMAFDRGVESKRRSSREVDDEDIEEEEGEEDDEDEDEDEAESSSAEELETSLQNGLRKEEEQSELTRAQRRELKKQKNTKGMHSGVAEGSDEEDGEVDTDLVNPNHLPQKMSKLSGLGEPRELTRKEREQKEKAEAKEKYWKLHVQGKTQEAKTDLARLAKIRAERESAQAKRKAEADAKSRELEAKKKEKLNKRSVGA